MPREKNGERSVVVTGASRGIGFAIAENLSQHGYHIVGVARSKPSDWSFGDFVETDLAEPHGVKEVVTSIVGVPGLWGLVNNVGTGSDETLIEIDPREFHRVLHLNTVVPTLLASKLAPLMKQGGRIVNVASVVAMGAVGRSAYGASKAAIMSLTRTWALELASRRITVNAVAPGPIETELFRSFNPVGSSGEARFLAQIPVGELGRPSDLAAFVNTVVSPRSSYLTGQVLYFDGGYSIGRTIP